MASRGGGLGGHHAEEAQDEPPLPPSSVKTNTTPLPPSRCHHYRTVPQQRGTQKILTMSKNTSKLHGLGAAECEACQHWQYSGRHEGRVLQLCAWDIPL